MHTTRKRESTLESESVAEETNIMVFVRCRGRKDREILDNSGVVVQTDGVTAKEVQLSLGPSALRNKTHQLDTDFSLRLALHGSLPAALLIRRCERISGNNQAD